MVDTADRPPARPETVWGACRALIQAAAGAAFVLEGSPVVGTLLLVVAAATAAYETVRWWTWNAGAPDPVDARPGGTPPVHPDGAPGASRSRAHGRAHAGSKLPHGSSWR